MLGTRLRVDGLARNINGRTCLLALLLAAALPSAPAAAEQSSAWASCRGGKSVTPQQSIEGCTAVMESNGAPRQQRAAAAAMRGRYYYLSGKLDLAVADFDMAVKLDPSQAPSFHYRGLSYAAKGALDRAIADFDTVIRLDPNFSGGYFRRGLA